MTTVAILFVVIAALLCAAACLALLGVGHLQLSGSDARERDGLARGQRAPAWSLPGADGQAVSSPPSSPSRPLQLIVFADHSLKSFPSVVAGLRDLYARHADDTEIVILTRGSAEHARPLLRELGLGGIAVLNGSPALYGQYNVRVMPFAIFVDAAGRVKASSLVNHDWQLAKLRQVAAIPLEPAEPAAV